MALLSGTYPVTMDDKNRVSMPVPFRKGIPDSMLVLTQGLFNCCIWAYTPKNWEPISDAVKNNKALTMPELDVLQHHLIFPSCEVELDQYGRITIPQKLKDFAKLNKEIVITSNEERIEIWDKEIHAEYEQKIPTDLPGIMNKVGFIPGL